MAEYNINKCAIGPVRKYVKTRVSSNSYVFKWEIENFSLLDLVLRSDEFSPFPECFLYCEMDPKTFQVTFFLHSAEKRSLTCHITVCDSKGRILLCKTGSYTHDKMDYDYVKMPDEIARALIEAQTHPVVISEYVEELKDLKCLPNDVLVIICRIYDDSPVVIHQQQISEREVSTPLDYLKRLATDLTDLSLPSSKQKIDLCVGYETEAINKCVLSAKSPVFKKMLQNLQPEKHENSLVIADVEISVVRSLVKFVNSGIIPECEADHLCDLYNAAVKYEVPELRDACSDQLVSKLSVKNVCQILFLAGKYSDDDLKMHGITFIRDNLETVLKSDEWQFLMREEPQTALEAITML
ncbi:Speckle-type POZ protein [Araneus ventricosus]|uniref:Speckle-type POZ protein n=1 Tax=Araneus ventricosus TaxID=182803 RepID=A0A4Y2C5R6_ARAVE|nr:Speckle-type POZ protein [Araneus ventricosus]